jgi:hypothetical protein
MTLGKLKNVKKYKNCDEFSTRQLSEAAESSHLPYEALYHVLLHFNEDSDFLSDESLRISCH